MWPGTLGIGDLPRSRRENQVSERAIAYVRSRRLADPDAARVFLLLARRTQAFGFVKLQQLALEHLLGAR